MAAGRRRLIVCAVLAAAIAAAPVYAGGYDGILEYYTLTAPDNREVPVYERMDIGSAELFRVPSGTEVKIISGNPEGWRLIEHDGRRGYATDGGLVILCSGNTLTK